MTKEIVQKFKIVSRVRRKKRTGVYRRVLGGVSETQQKEGISYKPGLSFGTSCFRLRVWSLFEVSDFITSERSDPVSVPRSCSCGS